MAQINYTLHGKEFTDDDGTIDSHVHWGVMLSPQVPPTGVYSGNDLA